MRIGEELKEHKDDWVKILANVINSDAEIKEKIESRTLVTLKQQKKNATNSKEAIIRSLAARIYSKLSEDSWDNLTRLVAKKWNGTHWESVMLNGTMDISFFASSYKQKKFVEHFVTFPPLQKIANLGRIVTLEPLLIDFYRMIERRQDLKKEVRWFREKKNEWHWFLSIDGSPSTKMEGKVLVLITPGNFRHRCNSPRWNLFVAGYSGAESDDVLASTIFPTLNEQMQKLEQLTILINGNYYRQKFHFKSDYSMLLKMLNHVSVLCNNFDGFGTATYKTFTDTAGTFGNDETSTFRLMTHAERVNHGSLAQQEAEKIRLASKHCKPKTIQRKLQKVYEDHFGQTGAPFLYLSDRISPEPLHVTINSTTHLAIHVEDFSACLSKQNEFYTAMLAIPSLNMVGQKMKRKASKKKSWKDSKWRMIGDQAVAFLLHFPSLLAVSKEEAWKQQDRKEYWLVRNSFSKLLLTFILRFSTPSACC